MFALRLMLALRQELSRMLRTAVDAHKTVGVSALGGHCGVIFL